MESVRCDFKYSRAGAAFIALAAAATCALLAATPWDGALRLALAAYVVAQAGRACVVMRRVQSAQVDLAGNVRAEFLDGSVEEGVLTPGGFVAPWMVCVRWRPAGARIDRTMLVLPDMLSTQDLRRLRILLRSA